MILAWCGGEVVLVHRTPSQRKRLTPRQLQIASMLLDRKKPKQIASELQVPWETVRQHVKWIYRRLDVGSQREMLSKYGMADLGRVCG